MSSSEDEEEPTTETDSAYHTFLQEELSAFRSHVNGEDDEGCTYASSLLPNALWSVAEKDTFFHALSVHSRLRPDLIAAEIRTKSVPDVCVYIALLDEALHKRPERATFLDEEYFRRTNALPKLRRKDFPAAHEVSEDWLVYEERMAEAVVLYEHTHEKELLQRDRDELVREYQHTHKARRGEGRTETNERDRAGEKARRREFKAWLGERKAAWAEEDVLRTLDKVTLEAMDMMLRQDEERQAVRYATALDAKIEDGTLLILDEEQLPGGSQTPAPGDEMIDPALLQLSRAALASSAGPSTSTSLFLSNAFQTAPVPLLDPSLLPTATRLPTAPRLSIPPRPEPNLIQEESVVDATDVRAMSPKSRRRHQKRLYMRRKRAEATGVSVNQVTERLKPGRKPKKPPPRAATPNAMPIGPTADGITPAVTVEQPRGSEGVIAGPDASEDYRHPHPSGTTRPYKRLAYLKSLGVHPEVLHRKGLGLFHLKSVAKLMRTYNRLHDVPTDVASQVTMSTLEMVYAHVAYFVAEVMSRAITSWEQERAAKLHTKVWRLATNQVVSASNVEHALALYGAESLDKKAHYQRLMDSLDSDDDDDDVEEDVDQDGAVDDGMEEAGTLDWDEDEGQGGNDAEGDEAEDDSGREDEVDEDEEEDNSLDHDPSWPRHLSLLRTIFSPIVYPPMRGDPTTFSRSALPDPSLYLPWPPETLNVTAAQSGSNDELLEEERNDSVDAVAAEEALDKADASMDSILQQKLWSRVDRSRIKQSPPPDAQLLGHESDAKANIRRGRKRNRWAAVGSAPDTETEGEDGDPVRKKKKIKKKGHLGERTLRYQEPDPNGRIKSSVYVLDSDSE